MKSHTYQPTKHPDLDKLVDSEGGWEFYFHKPTKRFLRSVTGWIGLGYAKGKWFEEWLLKMTREDAAEILKTAGDRGDKLHQAISLLLNGTGQVTVERAGLEVLSPETRMPTVLSTREWSTLGDFVQFWQKHKPTVVRNEYQVFCLDEVGMAGTLDAIIILTRPCGEKSCGCGEFINIPIIADWKTGSAIRPSYRAQIAAYKRCLDDMAGGNSGIRGGMNLRIGTKHKCGYETEFYDLHSLGGGLEAFNAARVIAIDNLGLKDFSKQFDPEKDIYEIPDSLTLEVKQQGGKDEFGAPQDDDSRPRPDLEKPKTKKTDKRPSLTD